MLQSQYDVIERGDLTLGVMRNITGNCVCLILSLMSRIDAVVRVPGSTDKLEYESSAVMSN